MYIEETLNKILLKLSTIEERVNETELLVKSLCPKKERRKAKNLVK